MARGRSCNPAFRRVCSNNERTQAARSIRNLLSGRNSTVGFNIVYLKDVLRRYSEYTEPAFTSRSTLYVCRTESGYQDII